MANSTSWQPVTQWYNQLVGNEGHYYHEHVILPQLKRLMALKKGDSLLDLGCGNGIIGRTLAAEVDYLGIDIAPQLIAEARRQDRQKNHSYIVGDITQKLAVDKKNFDQALILLALQNTAKPFGVIRNVTEHLINGGQLVLVLNHPAFRIPQLSDWGVDEKTNRQYRREDIYLTPQKIAIKAHPGKSDSTITYSFHYPLSAYSEFLHDNGMVITTIEEWISDKHSQGGEAKREDASRREFPLFLTIMSRKIKV